MTLNEWLAGNTVAAQLTQLNEDNLHHNDVLGFATRTQVIDILKSLRSLILPGIFERQPVNRTRLNAVMGMVPDTLSGRSPLYRLMDFLEEKDTELLPGEDIPADRFTDHNIGRALDNRITSYNVCYTKLLRI